MLLTGDYHTHTPYSHGKNTVEENVARASELGIKEIAITDHGFSHVIYGLRRHEVKKYRAECAAAEEKHGTKVLVGIESNIRSVMGQADLKPFDYDNFDIFLCGYHVAVYHSNLKEFFSYGIPNFPVYTLFKKQTERMVKRNTVAYINAVKNNPIDILTHVGFQCPCNPLEVAKCAADYGTYIELSGKKIHFTDDELNEMVTKTSVRFIINSDAHSISRIGDTSLIEEQLKRVQFPMERIDNIEGRMPDFRFTRLKNGD